MFRLLIYFFNLIAVSLTPLLPVPFPLPPVFSPPSHPHPLYSEKVRPPMSINKTRHIKLHKTKNLPMY